MIKNLPSRTFATLILSFACAMPVFAQSSGGTNGANTQSTQATEDKDSDFGWLGLLGLAGLLGMRRKADDHHGDAHRTTTAR